MNKGLQVIMKSQEYLNGYEAAIADLQAIEEALIDKQNKRVEEQNKKIEEMMGFVNSESLIPPDFNMEILSTEIMQGQNSIIQIKQILAELYKKKMLHSLGGQSIEPL